MSIFRTFLIAFSCLLALACSDQKQQAAQRFEHAAKGAFSSAVSNDGKYSLVSSIHHGVALWDNQQQVLKYQWFQHQYLKGAPNKWYYPMDVAMHQL